MPMYMNSIFTMTLSYRDYDYTYFTEEETEAQKDKVTSPGL